VLKCISTRRSEKSIVLSSSQKPPRGDFTNTPSHHPTGHLPTPTLTLLLDPPCHPPPPPLTLCRPAATSPPLPSPPTSAAPRRPVPSLERPVPSAAAPLLGRPAQPCVPPLDAAGATACAAGPKHRGPLPDAASPQPRGPLAAATGAQAQRRCRSGDTAVARMTNTWIRRTLHGSTRPAARCSPGSGSLSVAWASSDALLAALCRCDWGACTVAARAWRRRGAGTVEDGLRQVAGLGTLSAQCPREGSVASIPHAHSLNLDEITDK